MSAHPTHGHIDVPLPGRVVFLVFFFLNSLKEFIRNSFLSLRWHITNDISKMTIYHNSLYLNLRKPKISHHYKYGECIAQWNDVFWLSKTHKFNNYKCGKLPKSIERCILNVENAQSLEL